MPPISPFRGTSIPTIEFTPDFWEIGVWHIDSGAPTLNTRCLHGILGHFHGTLASMLLGGFSGTFPGRFFFAFFGDSFDGNQKSGGNAPVEVGW